MSIKKCILVSKHKGWNLQNFLLFLQKSQNLAFFVISTKGPRLPHSHCLLCLTSASCFPKNHGTLQKESNELIPADSRGFLSSSSEDAKGDLGPGEGHSRHFPGDFRPCGFSLARAPQWHKKQDYGIYFSFIGCSEWTCVLGMEKWAAALLLSFQAVFDSQDVNVSGDKPFPSELLLFTGVGFAAQRWVISFSPAQWHCRHPLQQSFFLKYNSCSWGLLFLAIITKGQQRNMDRSCT